MNGSTNRPAIWAWCVVVTALSLSPFAASAQQAQPTHPLDALTGTELHQIKAILQAEGSLDLRRAFTASILTSPTRPRSRRGGRARVYLVAPLPW